jgi:hypothetical protein
MEQFASGAGPAMNLSEVNKIEPEQLAKRIRKLALDCHHAVKNPFVTSAKMNHRNRSVWQRHRFCFAGRFNPCSCPATV